MTGIRGYVRASDQGLGLHSLDHFVLPVPSLAPAQRFYSDFGLAVQATGIALGLKTFGHDQQWGAWWANARSFITSRSAATPTTFLICRSVPKLVPSAARSPEGIREQRLLVSRSCRLAYRDEGRRQNIACA